jgi:hypothetical protein
MSFIPPFVESDALSHEIVDILQNYVPKLEHKTWRKFGRSAETDHVKTKEEFQLENGKYVAALKGVRKVNKQAAKERNMRAFENL